ncbi:probable RNA helicase armi isoform X1 [Solenopsis invicta]|uniref:probable RNA helicase armi isoform X1 n=1 Tax=Solenopsis invicta TaxID=13686 RepID=UPI000595C02C|nr:probable RNA helicase armi isoform X1 [Solenopsis invicta]XP_039308469.1 probable RNA helicase armi isoform X1 [Solenopsis invicta]
MLSLLYKGVQYALNYMSPDETAEEDIDQIIARLESTEETDRDATVKEKKTQNEEGCYYKMGTITRVSADYVIIDDCHMYEKVDDLTNNLNIGDKIHYLLYIRNPNTEPKVRKIIGVIDEWIDSNTKLEDVHNHVTLRNKIVKVTKREGRIAIVEPDNIRIDLSKVQSDFVPLIGDWLKLESLVELDENSKDLSGQILEVDRITSVRSMVHVGVISKYNPEIGVGVIDKKVVFHKRACGMGYIPCVGDKVASESIESDQGLYTWRSLTVVPLFETPNDCKSIQLPAVNNAPSIGMSDLLKNKYGIIIDDELNFNLDIGEESTLIVSIRNNGSYIHLLQGCSFMSQKTPSQLSLVSPTNTDISTVIKPSENVTYTFKCKAKFVGTSEEMFIFNFKDFKIARVFRITVNAKNISQKTDSTTQKHEKMNLPDLNELLESTCIPGIKPVKSPAFIKVRNGVFKIPRYMWSAVLDTIQNKKSQKECEIALEEQIPSLQKSLSFRTYKDRFHALLYLEEIALTLFLQKFDMKSAVMRRCGDYLVLEVPGLSEKRPSLLIGDKAIVSFPWDTSKGNLQYEGFIHKIKSTEIFLKFHETFHHEYYGEDCQVTFKSSYSTITRSHNAINLAVNRLGPDFLFPTKVVQKDPQFYLEEYEEENPTYKRVCDEHNKSISSDCSNSSITSINDTASNNTVKMSSRISVAEKLRNMKSRESSFEETMTSTAQTRINQNFKTNLTRNTSSSTSNVVTNTVTNETQTNNELKPYINQIKKRKLKWFNKQLNYYQKEAVKNIILGLARPLPYVIFGPPGTGKTVTICETILQLLTTIPESRLLVATPSNSSANLIAERLLDSNILKPGDMVRLIAHHCLDSDYIPERLLPYCATAELAAEGTVDRFQHHENGVRLNCTMSVLGRHRITIGTCSALGILYNMGFPRGHFSHILVDEAGQATEPEIMIPLNFIHSDNGQVILAGDPMQLGPVVMSKLALFFGFGESFLSRLLQQFPYQRDPEGFETCYDPRLVTKLVMNYRSLPDILDLPNSLFYESELQPQISSKNSKEAELLEMLRTELPERDGSPSAIIFHGINGENYQDTDSPSWYNPEEATQVYLYLLMLYKYGLEPDDIGIVTPYLKQVQKIRELLLELDLKLPKISSVEGFQGQERKVIIISTVRSCNNLIDEDVKHALGFVASPRRLNVAITRARALLIILGNPKLLILDPYWRSILTHCIDHGVYTGCNFLSSSIRNY